MLDRVTVKDFLEDELDELEDVKIPKDVSLGNLVEVFCRYTEEDYYEWLKGNFNFFIDYGNVDWDWIKDKIQEYQIQE